MMQHTLESHIKAFNQLCRCWGSLALTDKQKKNQSYPSLLSKHAYDILSIFDICVTDDVDHKHSKFICYTCVTRIRRAKNKSVGAVKSARQDKANSSLIWCGFAEGDARECSSCARRVKLSAGGPRKKSRKQKVTKILAVDKSCTAENEDVHLDEPLSPCRPVITSDDDSFTPALSALLQTNEVNAHDDSTAIKLSDQRRPFTPFKKIKDTSTEMTPPKTSTPNNAWTSSFKAHTVECAVSQMEKSTDLFNVSKGIEDSIEKSVSKLEDKMYEITTRKKLFQREKRSPTYRVQDARQIDFSHAVIKAANVHKKVLKDKHLPKDNDNGQCASVYRRPIE